MRVLSCAIQGIAMRGRAVSAKRVVTTKPGGLQVASAASWASSRSRRGGICVALATLATTLASVVVLALPAAATGAGTWSITPTPNVGSAQNNHLADVSCTSPTFCVAVGHSDTATGTQILLLTWNGSTWSLESSSSLSPPGSLYNQLNGVSCVSASFCVAVGGSSGGNFLLTWNGAAWKLDSSSSLSTSPSQFNNLLAVSCSSPSFCVAAGYFYTGTATQNLLLTWNGTSWALDSAGSLSTSSSQYNTLNGVSCVSAEFCVAVGAGTHGNLLLTWNGTSWALDSAASLSTSSSQYNTLNGVSCATTTFCVAVGHYFNGTSAVQNLILTWNGTAWSLDSATSLSTSALQYNGLSGVSCASSSFCVAVGTYDNPVGTELNLVLTWNGSSWSVDSSTSLSPPASIYNSLMSVSCPSASSCNAAGQGFNGTIYQNVVLSWSAPAAPPPPGDFAAYGPIGTAPDGNGLYDFTGTGSPGGQIQIYASCPHVPAFIVQTPPTVVPPGGTWAITNVEVPTIGACQWMLWGTITSGNGQSAPSAPVIAVGGGFSNGGTIVNGGTPTFNIYDPPGALGNPMGGPVNPSGITYSLDGQPYAPGTSISTPGAHVLVVSVLVDSGGNHSSVTIGFHVVYRASDTPKISAAQAAIDATNFATLHSHQVLGIKHNQLTSKGQQDYYKVKVQLGINGHKHGTMTVWVDATTHAGVVTAASGSGLRYRDPSIVSQTTAQANAVSAAGGGIAYKTKIHGEKWRWYWVFVRDGSARFKVGVDGATGMVTQVLPQAGDHHGHEAGDHHGHEAGDHHGHEAAT